MHYSDDKAYVAYNNFDCTQIPSFLLDCGITNSRLKEPCKIIEISRMGS